MKKRILALLTAAALLLTTATQPTQATQPTRPVEMSDVLDILKSLVGIAAPLSLDYDFNQNGVIDTGDALEGLKSLIGAREVVMLPIVPQPLCECEYWEICAQCWHKALSIEVEPLCQELNLRIRQDWVTFFNSRTDPKDVHMGYYFGTYNENVVFWRGHSPMMLPWFETVAGFEFWVSTNSPTWVWKDGIFTPLSYAFQEGWLTEEDIATIWILFTARNFSYDAIRERLF